MNNRIRRKLARGKRKNQYRLRDIEWEDQPRPLFSASNIKYDLTDKARGLACERIGAIHTLARQSGLIDAIDRRLHLLKIHKPYNESDHVLNIAYNLLCGGQRVGRVIDPALFDYVENRYGIGADQAASLPRFVAVAATAME